MALTVKKVKLWRKEVPHDVGVLADVLGPLAEAGASLRVVMGYVIPGASSRAAIEVFPISGKRMTRAAGAAGLKASPIACLLVEGDDRPGLGADMARAIAATGVNISFLMAETVGKKFSAIFGFDGDKDASSASRAIRSVARRKRR